MPTFTVNIDTTVHVYNSIADTLIGQRSGYTAKPHPGTNNTIDGWRWDGRDWSTDSEVRGTAFSPSIWDPTLSGIDDALLQSGYGDNNDLLLLDIEEVLLSGLDVWAPRLQHGYFYTGREEWYLFADCYITDYFTVTGIEDGQQILPLSNLNKPTIPIQVRNWKFNPTTSQHEININFRKKIAFTVSGEEPEFLVDTSFSPPVLRLNGEYSKTWGIPIVLIPPGIANAADIATLEHVGISNGEEDQSFFTLYSPIDSTQTIEVWSWDSSVFPTQWNVIDPVDQFTISGYEVKVDLDRGSIQFGNGNIPADTTHIGIHYTTAIAAQYEPKDTQDDILAYSASADINPLSASTSRGFVQVTTESVDPATIVLSSSLPQVNPFIIQLGNNIGEIIGEVKNGAGQVLEGQDVTFQILGPVVGTFGATATEANAVTGSDGRANTFYNSPITIQSLGQATISVVQSGTDTIVTVEGIVEPATVSNIYIYKIHEYDEALGIPAADEDTYYTNYLSDEDMVTGIMATISGEQSYRTTHGFLPPETYSISELLRGKKTMLLTTRDGTMNPHSGFIEPGILVPLHPDSIESIGTNEAPVLRMVYTDILLDLPGASDTKGYFVVGDTQTRLQAYVTNQRTNNRVFSNIIQLEIQIPDSLNGTFFCEVLNDIPFGLLTTPKNVYDISDNSIDTTSGITSFLRAYLDERNYVPVSGIFESYVEWFRRTRRGDTVAMTLASLVPPDGIGDPTLSGLDIVTPIDCPAEIPIGFRLKSTGITVASILDQVTYLDPNDNLPSGHFLVL